MKDTSAKGMNGQKAAGIDDDISDRAMICLKSVDQFTGGRAVEISRQADKEFALVFLRANLKI